MAKERKQTKQQLLNNFLRSLLSKEYDLKKNDIAVLHALASFFYYKETCNPKVSHIKQYLCSTLSERQIGHSLVNLDKIKLIKKNSQPGARNFYEWNVPVVLDAEIYSSKNKQVLQKSTVLKEISFKDPKKEVLQKSAVLETNLSRPNSVDKSFETQKVLQKSTVLIIKSTVDFCSTYNNEKAFNNEKHLLKGENSVNKTKNSDFYSARQNPKFLELAMDAYRIDPSKTPAEYLEYVIQHHHEKGMH